MEIETITLEPWMCRICLEKEGSYNIFKDWLGSSHPLSLSLTTVCQGQPCQQSSANSVPIIDALNCFSQFQVSQSEIENEPMMLCENCSSQLLQCYLFRKKVQDAECLLRRDFIEVDTGKNEEFKQEDEGSSGLTQQFEDINPYLSHDMNLEEIPSNDAEQEKQDVVIKHTYNKVHHAKPRFQLTNQVSNILRHVTASKSRLNSLNEKRKESSIVSSTPKKMKKIHTSASDPLEKTLVIPSYVFTSEIEDAHEKHVLRVEGTSISASCQIPSDKDVDRKQSSNTIFYCKHCPKAFSAPYHLLVHTRSSHLCQHCLQLFSNVSARNKHIRDEHKLFRCSLCDFQSQYVTNLRTHLRKAHSVCLPAHVSILQKREDT
ncbi:zinc finger and SCAN domain-containing protein 4 [Sabethes cyaneus]|uniref:zinc finger and SCAN domain-containing protein 4 n=1 Tax=Sabethes cyaneus TaxID=53552 RepID=UPI00237DFEDA|nr:zinc finger and SCAN domain-containing protein 4 [Sabethes cyaneus]